MRKTLIALALLAATMTADAATSKAPAPPASVAFPALADPAAEWTRFYASAEAEDTMAAYGILGKMYAGKGEPGEDCRSFLPALDAAIGKVPVGIALWRAGELCGRKLQDAAIEKRYADGVGKLAAHALARSGAGPDSKPIVVMTGDDIKAIIDATGLEAEYGYGEWKPNSPYARLTYALFDKEQGIERHLGFDYLDTYFRTSRKNENAGYPGYRHALRGTMLAAMAKGSDFTARDLGIADASRAQEQQAQQLDELRASAAKGGLVSADFWWSLCATGKDAACADGLVEALLPRAEQGMAMFRLQLALAYATGVGVGKDLAASMTLLDAAEKRWPGNAYGRFAEQLLDNDIAVPDPALERLDRSARQGNRRAMAAWAAAQVARLGDATELPAALLPRMLELGDKNIPAAQLALARHFYAKDPTQAREWLRRGAGTGDPDLLQRLAVAQVYANPGPRELAAGIETMRAAARAGDAHAMRWMGVLAVQRKQWAEANSWYGSAIDYGNTDALVPLLEMYQEPHPGLSPTPAELLGKYKALEEAGFNDAGFRRSYAAYLVGKASPRDPQHAMKLLLTDAEKGDVQSQVQLAIGLLEGKFGAADAKQGMAWMDKATSKDNEAKDAFANYLYYRDRSAPARQRAFAIERELIAADVDGARNNLAWWLCTSEDASLRSPKEGLRIALEMGTVEEVEAPALDTVAACHAAAGDFTQAEAVQRVVVERSALFPMTSDDSELGKRLELFRNHKPYIETREDESSPES